MQSHSSSQPSIIKTYLKEDVMIGDMPLSEYELSLKGISSTMR